jgi:hypothetical protein
MGAGNCGLEWLPSWKDAAAIRHKHNTDSEQEIFSKIQPLISKNHTAEYFYFKNFLPTFQASGESDVQPKAPHLNLDKLILLSLNYFLMIF